tara:strand:+ start:360 stop:1013 length:654 start_codon:yes stop_codon:yes gene_type:complete
MGLFSKKEKVPEIPPAPPLPKLPSLPAPEAPQKKDLPKLPSLPTQETVVKDAVSDNQTPEDNEVVVDMPPQGGIHNIESAIPSPPSPQSPPSSIPAIPSFTAPTAPKSQTSESSLPELKIPQREEHKRRTLELSPSISNQPKFAKQEEPIFVRIDKFQEAQKDFKYIKIKIKEIESVLKKVKTIKEKEEAEISSWSQDLEKLKARLAEIDANIFDKL